MKAAVIGYPISHSFSPLIFFYFSHVKSEKLTYEKIRIEDEKDKLKLFLTKIKNDPSYLGLNVTIPHKKNVLAFCDEISAEAKDVGAVNVLHFFKSKIFGYNTDIYGIEKSLEKFQEKNYWNLKRILLIGAGGAAQGVLHVLCHYNVKAICILNRSKSGSEDFLKNWRGKFPHIIFEWEDFEQLKLEENSLEKNIISFDLVINSTPLGMNEEEDAKVKNNEIFSMIFRNKYFSKNCFAFDLIYQPRLTSFLFFAEEKGMKCLGGLEMLIQQAKATWEIWFAHEKNKISEFELNGCGHFLQEIIHLREKKENIVLIGFMGSGKSTLGKIIADFLGGELVETDQLIEAEEGKSISEIFNEKGEHYFRECEGNILRKLVEEKKLRISTHKLEKCYVYSTGGGILLKEEHQKLLKNLGVSVYLKCSGQELSDRLQNERQKRPILANLSPEDSLVKIEELLASRKSDYQNYANIIISSGESSQSACVIDIIHQVSGYQENIHE